jgi:hypothetical protein
VLSVAAWNTEEVTNTVRIEDLANLAGRKINSSFTEEVIEYLNENEDLWVLDLDDSWILIKSDVAKAKNSPKLKKGALKDALRQLEDEEAE